MLAPSSTPPAYPLRVGGQWISTTDAGWLTTVNPADTRQELGRFPQAGARELRAALDAAQAESNSWAARTPTQRATPLYRAAEMIDARAAELAELVTREQGKTLSEATGEVKRTAAVLRFYAGQAHLLSGQTVASDEPHTLLMTVREPVGVAAAITPWNFPLSIPARKLAPALVAGCPVVFKPASLAPLSAFRLVEVLVEAGLPAGVVNFVVGPGQSVADVLCADPRLRAVSFTGSSASGDWLRRRVALGVRIQLELGGKNALVVTDDADLDLAARLAVQGAFGLSGQACTATSRLIVMRAVADRLLDKVLERTRRLQVGSGLDPDVLVGPLASAEQERAVLDWIQVGHDEGARLLIGGRKLSGPNYDDGYFVEPTIFACDDPGARVAQEEIFGPVLTVLTVDTFEHAVRVCNDSRYGLVAAICTRDIHRAHAFWYSAEVGVVKVNRGTSQNVPNVPFGGIKDSSADTIKEFGTAGLDFFSRTKTVYLGH